LSRAWKGITIVSDRWSIVVARQALLGAHVQSLKEHPPLQVASSFNLSKIMLQVGSGAN